MPEVVKIVGLTELQAALTRLETEVPRQVAFVNAKAGSLVGTQARGFAPSGPHEGGGSVVPIADSIHVEANATMAKVIAGGPKTPHAGAYEFGGTIPRRGYKGANRRAKRVLRLVHLGLTKITKHPYLFRALEAKAPEVYRLYETMVGDLLSRFGE